MNDSNRKRRNVVLGTDLLESRALLNAHLPQSPIVHVASLHAEASKTKPITGTLSGTQTFDAPSASNPPGPLGPALTFSASGSSTVGTVTLTARSHDQVTLLNNRTTVKSTYPDGSGTLKLGDGSTLTLTYTGTRVNQTTVVGKPTPRATYSYKGKATVESGTNSGRVYKFTASGSGLVTNPTQTLHFTLK